MWYTADDVVIVGRSSSFPSIYASIHHYTITSGCPHSTAAQLAAMSSNAIRRQQASASCWPRVARDLCSTRAVRKRPHTTNKIKWHTPVRPCVFCAMMAIIVSTRRADTVSECMMRHPPTTRTTTTTLCGHPKPNSDAPTPFTSAVTERRRCGRRVNACSRPCPNDFAQTTPTTLSTVDQREMSPHCVDNNITREPAAYTQTYTYISFAHRCTPQH